ncbi:MAG: ACP synthase [Phycisphaerae bacterium]|nr:ACP synthase [Phycisphaerae bacterium]MBM91546.1 ACP synthase [Phycisphaerae bacterium]HCT44405.1 holo-[acyl-carrier-protein] synthase [Phycisphaerales bacterium]|tara:strand:- start:210 stop:590 length:381 start_codon:yes stop_codon:yes gene_type:complete
MIIGHGVDIVETARIKQMLGDHPERFLERCFTPGEQEDSKSSRRQLEHLAARFAAKEATLKALGTGWAQGIGWTDIEVVRAESGKPSLKVTGRAGEIAAEMGITTWHLSMSHVAPTAIASVIAEGA